VNYFKLQREFL